MAKRHSRQSARDTARSVAFNPAAPPDERRDAQEELTKASMPTSMSDLIPRADLAPVIDYINESMAEAEFAKSLRKQNVIPFPSSAVKAHQRGMQSVSLDDLQINAMGEWFDKPGVFGFDSMRAMVDQTPILSAIVFTRLRQVSRFCRANDKGDGPGFHITTKEPGAEVGEDQKKSIKLLQDFFSNSGWEANPRKRRRLKRDDFQSMMLKLTRDSLVMDSCAIETEFKRDRSLGMDGLYSVDGSTIRLCSEEGYQGDDEIYALQVVQGRIRAAYTYDDLIYVPRNPRADVLVGGYGFSETELLVRTVTGFLNAFNYNQNFFDKNSIPKGLLHLSGNYTETDIASFKRLWNSMVRGVNNAWTLPVMVSKDQESKASFESFAGEVNEIMFAKWMTFLTSLCCAIYSIAPDEINFESFTSGASSLSGSDTTEKLASSKDKGLRPLLTYFENTFTDYVVSDFSTDYVFRFTGLDDEDPQINWERKKLTSTANELRAEDGRPAIKDKWGDAPLNPALMSAWQMDQQQPEDFGQPGQGQPGAGGGQPGDPNQPPDGGGEDYGQADDEGQGQDFGQDPGQGGQAGEEPQPDEMAKAFGLPVFKVKP